MGLALTYFRIDFYFGDFVPKLVSVKLYQFRSLQMLRGLTL